jgi:hypothetical protein
MQITIDLEFDSQAYADENTYRVNTPEYMIGEMKHHIMYTVKGRFEPSSYTFNAHVIEREDEDYSEAECESEDDKQERLNSRPFNDPTGLFDGHIDGGEGCPCGACAFCRGSGAGE